MIRLVIIEDEKLIAEELQRTLMALPVPVQVMAVLGSVRESLAYFSEGSHADLVLSDIQLPDGLSFSIFENAEWKTPVVFITGFDSFLLNGFEHNGIDYLLKPVEEKDLLKVLLKYKNLEQHFVLRQNIRNLFGKGKERLVVRKGFTNVLLWVADIVLFYSESKVVFVVDKEGKKYVSDQNLTDLQAMLDGQIFFRANRQHIININYVRSYKAHDRVKLSVDLCGRESNHSVVISQETAPYFRKWVNEI